jgi:hypothetical protein
MTLSISQVIKSNLQSTSSLLHAQDDFDFSRILDDFASVRYLSVEAVSILYLEGDLTYRTTTQVSSHLYHILQSVHIAFAISAMDQYP